MLHHRRRSALLLPGCIRLDVSGGCAAVPHAGRRVRERVLAQEVLLPLRVPHPSRGGGHLCGHRLQKLWNTASVSVFLKRFFICGSQISPYPHQLTPMRHMCMC